MMVKFLLWCILLVLCWPLALLALVLYPIVWLILLPFRILGIAVDGVFDLLRGILFLPGRILRGPRSAWATRDGEPARAVKKLFKRGLADNSRVGLDFRTRCGI
jgi:hypothetical protein